MIPKEIIGYKIPPIYICIFCGKQYELRYRITNKNKKERKFCSKECRNKSGILRHYQKHTEETKRKISLLQKGLHRNPQTEFKKGLIPWNKGKKWKAMCGKNNPNYGKPGNWLGKHHSEETIKKISGVNCHLWKGGITPLYIYLRRNLQYKNMIKEIFQRDNYICQKCGKNGKLHAHHIKAFSIILKEFLHQYSQFSPIEDKETLSRLAMNYEPFWNKDNFITLCYKCHCKYHPILCKLEKINERNMD